MKLHNISLIVIIVLLISVIGVIAEMNNSDNSSNESVTNNDSVEEQSLSSDMVENISENTSENASEPVLSEDVTPIEEKVATESPKEADSEETAVLGVEKVKDCVDEKYTELVPVMGKCQYEITVCDETNTSCHKVAKEYDCEVDYQTVEKIKSRCEVKGYIIDEYKIDTQNYECSAEKDSEGIILTCDSKYDGNGDGICTSGESCVQFIIKNGAVAKYQKNSKDKFVEQDDSFFLEQPVAEVLQ